MSYEEPQDQRAAVKRLLELINVASAEVAEEQFATFSEEMGADDEEVLDPADLLWTLKDVIDWESGYYVDWKDTQSFIACLDRLTQAAGLEIDWGIDDTEDEDFLDSTSVEDLMQLAHEQLQQAGFTLWNWNTEGDAYGGWITRREDDAEMLNLASTLGIEVRPADEPF
ncbi:DUF6630 family protein [Caldimonas brevitalea]|uniref:DUF6630 domain-containing protein n=1 Tax=Caldimonas brevitalea TaxID=413882 RepID=A0A0G3BXP9_9BURK|nr:hypothetical protein [Caldimonas brevitalea]AKJ32171.1 hypothetical protein AAW51_5480 [Caldimonas brevitalea]